MDAQQHNHQAALAAAVKLMMGAGAAFVAILPLVLR